MHRRQLPGGLADHSRTWRDIGYPIVEAEPDGTFVITKHPGTGGRVTVASIKEQLLYEMGDPREYITPDCIADFTSIQLEQVGPDRVRFSGIRGKPATDMYKVSISYSAGFKAIGTLMYSWPDAYAKAQAADRDSARKIRPARPSLRSDSNGIRRRQRMPRAAWRANRRPTSRKWFCAWACDPQIEPSVERFTKEIAPLALNGPPTVTGLGSGRPKVEEIVAYWPALIPKTEAHPEISVAGDLMARVQAGSHRARALRRQGRHRQRRPDRTASPNIYPVLAEQVTAERVKKHFRGICLGQVERFELPNLGALNFLLHESLDGGGTLSLKADAQGKTYSAALLRMEIEVPDELLSEDSLHR